MEPLDGRNCRRWYSVALSTAREVWKLARNKALNGGEYDGVGEAYCWMDKRFDGQGTGASIPNKSGRKRPVELVCWQRLPAGDEEEAGVLPESGESQFGAAVGIAVVGILDVCAFSKEGIAFV